MQVEYFKITVHGCATHGATPHLGADAIVAAGKIIEALQTIISRNANPLDEVSVIVGTVHSGTQFNIVADTAVMEGGVFVLDRNLFPWVETEIFRITSDTAKSMKCTADIEFTHKTAKEEER